TRCRIFACEDGSVVPLDACELVGAGMLRLESSLSISQPVDELRASRTRGALGAGLHDRLRQTTVTVVGLGRSGSQLCFQLASVGVGRLRLLDADIVGVENLDGMPGLIAEDVG